MKVTKFIMGMPIIVEVVDRSVLKKDLEEVFAWFRRVDRQFSPYKKTSEVSRLNRKEITFAQASAEMREVLVLAEKAKQETQGYFDVTARGFFDPSGIVKSWAIEKASQLLQEKGLARFYINAGGDIQVSGRNAQDADWLVGIRHPFIQDKIVKTVRIPGAIATSGTYLRGDHIYDPHRKGILKPASARDYLLRGAQDDNLVSLSVIAGDIVTADVLATASFAMGRSGIMFRKTADVEGI